MKNNGFTTKVLHSDRLSGPEHGSLHKPIHTSVAYGYENVADLAAVFQGTQKGYAYGRQSNPTVTALEEKVTALEEGVATVCFATGMAAIGAVCFSLLKEGDHLISSAYLFGNTNSLLQTFARIGIEVSFVDATRAENVEKEIKSNTRMVFVETIANPVTQVADLQNLGKLCKKKGLLYVVDNTMTTPYLFKPHKVGAGLSVNSLTKGFCGHGNALGGAVTDLGTYPWEKFGNILEVYKNRPPELWGYTQIRKKGLRDLGAALSPEDAHRISVGAETMALRLDRACENALGLARYLESHPSVAKVYYPGLEGHAQHQKAKEFFSQAGTIVSFELVSGLDCMEVLNKLRVAVKSSNLGDNRTLTIPVAHTIYWEMGPQRRQSMGIDESLIRVSVGIEDFADLKNDFESALA